MLSVLAFIIGLAIPALLGWLLIRVIEGKTSLLQPLERLAWSLVWGPTAMAALTAALHWVLGVPLNAMGFLGVAILLIVILSVLIFRTSSFRPLHPAAPLAHSKPWKRSARIGLGILCVWTVLKVFAGSIDLFTVPTFWDDSFNNWNMRGKMFFVEERIELQIPIGNQIVSDEKGVSSYPPTLPMIKTWMADIRGEWVEGMVNGIHAVWLIALLAMFYYALRRHLGRQASALGVYLLASIPLLLIQGTNPYADAWLAAHLFICAVCLLQAAQADVHAFRRWLMLLGVGLGLLLWTKNEAFVLYAPAMVIATIVLVRVKTVREHLDQKTLMRPLFAAAGIGLLVLAPWLLFKLFNGLTFGNAKGVFSVTFGYNPAVPQAIWFHFTREPNWLILPLAFAVTLIASGKRAWQLPWIALVLPVVIIVPVQMLIFTFTSIANEAIMQTGLSRGVLHVIPVILLLTILMTYELIATRSQNQH